MFGPVVGLSFVRSFTPGVVTGEPHSFSNWSDADKESFLMKAEVVKMKKVHTGVTGTKRATLSDGSCTHDASVQSVDISKTSNATAEELRSTSGTPTSTTSLPIV